jgi:Protein of unknown function (DUF1549)/Protein of unknown function (DUF1553)
MLPRRLILVMAILPIASARADHWAFQPPKEPKIPSARSIAGSPLDAFVFSRLEEKRLKPAPPADKRTLIRRATFDLVGLPPTPEEIEVFLQDHSPNAFAKVVDRLLASPHYGERWGRHWLDVARYADSNGMDENLVQANAWRYRDYVIRSLNADKPFDQFVREQLAGDLLPGNGFDRLIATGFLSLGPKMLAEDDAVKMEMDIVDEQVDTVGKVFMGLTLGCARCHDHKFDPISMADYYGLAGIFKSTKVMDNFKVVARWHERPIATPEQLTARREADERISAKQVEIQMAERAFARRWWADVGRHLALLGQSSLIVAPVLPRESTQSLSTLATSAKRLREEKAALMTAAPALPEAMGAADGKAATLRIHLRGSHLTLGADVPRRFPLVLAGKSQQPLDGRQSGRLQLAEWLTRPDHPLTARVIVNRVWHWHFGSGLVRSTDNFGLLGDRPSHLELLDWLALRCVDDGWSLKSLHRRIMLSATYQMGSVGNEIAAQADPDNRLHWRFNRQRLDAETLRDSLLAVSGSLDRTMGGSLLQGNNRGYVPGYPNGVYDKYGFARRSVYLPVIRSMLYDVFQAFDFADPSTPNGERASTTIAPQALFALNGKLVGEQSKALATRLLKAKLDDAGKVSRAYALAFGRPPTANEVTRSLEFVRKVESEWRSQKIEVDQIRIRGWQSLCRAILAANEFVYVE